MREELWSCWIKVDQNPRGGVGVLFFTLFEFLKAKVRLLCDNDGLRGH